MFDRDDPTLLINILAPETTMTDSLTHDGKTTIRARTVADARKLARKAKHHDVYCSISDDVGIDVRSSRAGILDALKGMPGTDPCGGIYWPDLDIFRLDRTVQP